MQVMVGNNYGSYNFNAATGVITLSGLPTPLTAGQVKLIVNAKTNTIIFNLADTTRTAAISGSTIVLSYNTGAMGNSDPLQIFMDVPAEYVPQAVVGTFWQATQPVNGSVSVANLPSTQTVSGSVSVSNLPSTQAVTGTFWQATQPVSGTVAVSGSVAVTGTFYQATQPVSGSVSITGTPSVSVSNFPASQAVTGVFWQTTQPVSSTQLPASLDGSGNLKVAIENSSIAVTGTFWQTTQPVSGSVSITGTPSVSVSNFPSSQAVTGTFWQTTQPVSGTVAVSAVSGSVAVTGTFWQATQPVSGSVSITGTPAISGTVTSNQGSANTAANAWPTYTTVSGAAVDPRQTRALTSADQVTIANSSLAVVTTAQQNTTDANNTTTTPLAANAVFTGAATSVSNYASVEIGIYSDQSSATNGLQVEWSPDGTNWDYVSAVSYTGGAGLSIPFPVQSNYFRLIYTNGGTLQTSFRLYVLLIPVSVISPTQVLSQQPTNANLAVLNRSVLTGRYNTAGVYMNVGCDSNGNLLVDQSFIGNSAIAISMPGVQKVGVVGGSGGGAVDGAQNAAAPANALVIGGVFNSAVQTITTGHLTALQTDVTGNLNINLRDQYGNPLQLESAAPTAANYYRLPVNAIPLAAAGIGASCSAYLGAAQATAVNLKATSGNLYGLAIVSATATAGFIEFFDTATTATSGAVWAIPIAASGTVIIPPSALALMHFANGIAINVASPLNGTTTQITWSGTVMFK